MTKLKSNPQIEARLKQFANANNWFNELCFCILTANSKAQTALNIEKELLPAGFTTKTQEELAQTLKRHGHRFHNNKAKFIVLARQYLNIKEIMQSLPPKEAREFLVKNIKGLGYKEASHFLRNVGYHDFAIIDRHILRFLNNNSLIQSIPKSLTPKKYLEYEAILKTFKIPLDKLDLIIWQKMTGKVLK